MLSFIIANTCYFTGKSIQSQPN